MPSFTYPYNYCERDDPAATWAAVTEFEMRLKRLDRVSLRVATIKATAAFRRLAIAIGGVDVGT